MLLDEYTFTSETLVFNNLVVYVALSFNLIIICVKSLFNII